MIVHVWVQDRKISPKLNGVSDINQPAARVMWYAVLSHTLQQICSIIQQLNMSELQGLAYTSQSWLFSQAILYCEDHPQKQESGNKQLVS